MKNSIFNILGNPKYVGNMAGAKIQLLDLQDAVGDYSIEVVKAATSQVVLNEKQATAIFTAKGLKGAQLEEAVAATMASKAHKESTTSTTGLGLAFQGLGAKIKSTTAAMWTFLTTTPAGWATLAVAALAALVGGVYAYNKAVEKAVEDAREKIDELTSSIDDINNSLKQTQSTVSDTARRFAELSQGIDRLSGKNISLSTDDYEEFLDLSNQLAELLPTLPKIYDENGNAIVSLEGDVDGIVGSLQNLVEVQRQLANQEIADKLPELYENTIKSSDAYIREIEQLEARRTALLQGLEEFSKEDFTATVETELNTGVIEISTTNLEEYARMVDDYTKMLDEAGVRYETNHTSISTAEFDSNGQNIYENEALFVIDPESITEDVKEKLDIAVNNLSKEYNNSIKALNTEIENITNDNQSSWSNLTRSLISWLYSDPNSDYAIMSDELQASVQRMLSSIDWSDFDAPNGIEDIKDYIQNGLIEPLSENPELKNTFIELFSIDEGDLDRIDVANELQSMLDDLGITFDVSPIVADEKDAKRRLQNKINEIVSGNDFVSVSVDADEYEYLSKQTENLTESEIEMFLSVADASKTATENMRLFQQAQEAATEVTSEPLSLEDYLNRDSMSDIRADLIKLAESGEITPETFNSTREYRDILTDLGITAEEAADQINNMVDIDMSGWQNQYKNAISTIEKLKSLQSDLGGGVTNESLGTIIEEFPQLLAYIDDEVALQEAVNVLIGEQSNLAQEAANSMLDYNEALYTEIVNGIYADVEKANSSLINTLAEGYGIDLRNFSTLAQAKEEIDVQLLQTLMKMWGEYYGIVVDSVTGMASITQNLPYFYQNEDAQNQLAAYNQIITKLNASKDKFEGIDFGDIDAGSAGSDAGDAYVEAFEEELAQLETLRDQGKISEAQYLEELRKLYIRYFKDRKEYIDEFEKYERQYLEGMKSLYNSALSGIGTLLNRKIDAAEDGKEAAVSALEAEQEAAESAYQAQMDAIEAQIDAIERQKDSLQDIIDAKQDEIDRINEASEARQREIDLQRAQYELERMMNQRVANIYNGEQMVYVQDTDGIRDALENRDDINEEIEIAGIEKEISALEDQIDRLDDKIDGLEDQKDKIQDLMDSTNQYYENLISQTEKFWDSIIEKMNDQKDRWAELGEMAEIAEAFSAVQQVFGELGYTVDDVLNGSDAAFNDFKSKYVSLLSEMNSGNQSFQEGLSYAAGVGVDQLGTFTGTLSETSQNIDPLTGAVDSLSGSMDNLSNSSQGVNSGLSSSSQSLKDMNDSTTGVADNLTAISDGLADLVSTTGFETINTHLGDMADAISKIATAIGSGTEDTVGGLVSALASLDGVQLSNISTQFSELKTAVDSVTSAISGGGGIGGEDTGNSKSPSMGADAGGGAGGLTGALEDHGKTATTVLGGGEGEEGSGEIGKFGELKTSVDDVTASIGTSSEGGDNADKSEESTTSLTGALEDHYKVAEVKVPAETELFNALKTVMGEAKDYIAEIKEMLEEMDGKTFKVNLEIEGLGGGTVSFESLIGQQAKGVKNLKKSELSWTQEAGREIIISPSRNAMLTPLNAGDSVLKNELTENLFKWGAIDPTSLPSTLNLTPPDYSAMTSSISNSNQAINVGDINVNCSGVTSQEVAVQAGAAIRKELQGIYLDTYQYSHRR